MVTLKSYLSSPKVRKTLSTKPGREGFSLVELVVVIAVLAILAAVAIPAFQGVQSQAKVAAVKNGLVNGVKECAVSDAMDLGFEFSKAKAYSGSYSGYQIDNPKGTNSCYIAVATNTDGKGLPEFSIRYDAEAGTSTKTCKPSNGVGCNASGAW